MKYKVGQIVKFKWYNKIGGRCKILQGKIINIGKDALANAVTAEIERKECRHGILAANIVELCIIATLKEIKQRGKTRTNSKNTTSIY